MNDKPIQELTLEECEKAIAAMAKKYNLEKTISKYTDDVDQIVNQLADLEQRREYLVMMEKIQKANAARWANVAE